MKMISKILIPIIVTLIVSTSYGTIQRPEILIIDSDTIMIEECPLNDKIDQDWTLFTKGRKKNTEICVSTAYGRGYKGTWTIINDSLFLAKLLPPCDLKENEENPFALEKLFKDIIPLRGVYAYWVNDTLNTRCIILPCDKIDKHFVVSNGIVIKIFETINDDWKERHTDFKEPIEEDLDADSFESESSNHNLWYFLAGGIVLIIIIKRRLTPNKFNGNNRD